MRTRSLLLLPVVALATSLVAACGDDGSPPSRESSPADDPVIQVADEGQYQAGLDPADVVDGVDHPLLPLRPGSRWVYEGESDGELERVEVIVLEERRSVMGISAVVVRDTVTVDGELEEDTYDWFAQDRDGNVWYLGEDSTEFVGGEPSSKEGSWEAGVDGAQPGIVMPAVPTVGHAYRQEHLPGEAEDLAEVVQVGAAVQVATGAYEDVVVTREWNPLEPEVVEEKSYAPGVGLVLEVKTRGGDGRLELVAFQSGEVQP